MTDTAPAPRAIATACARPGCASPAIAWLTYDYAARTVWLDDSGEGGGDRWALCAGHAARLRVPNGWAQVDRRSAFETG